MNEQTTTIKQLIWVGRNTIKDMENAVNLMEKNARIVRDNSWEAFLKKVKENIPISIVDYLSIEGADYAGSCAPPVLTHASLTLLQIKINGLAPIALEFNNDNRINQYIVPEIRSHTLSGERYGWEFYGQDRVHGEAGTKVLETKDLALALAVAEQRYQLMQKMLADWQQKVAEEEAKEKARENELVYVDEDGSEPLPDQVVINGIRAIIREEVHKMAMAD